MPRQPIMLLILRPLATSRTKGYQGQSPWLVGIRSTFAVPHLAQSSEHANTFTSFAAPRLKSSMFGSVARTAQTRPRIAPPCNLAARDLLAWSDERRQDGSRSLPAMSDLVFVIGPRPRIRPLRVCIGEKLLHHLLRVICVRFLATIAAVREELNSYVRFIWSTIEVNRRPTRPLAPATTCMLRICNGNFPLALSRLLKPAVAAASFLDDIDVVGSPPCKLPPNR